MKKVFKKREYVLKNPIKGKGNVGEIVKVAPGYGRYLERFAIAVRATKEIKENLEQSKLEWISASKSKEVQAEKLIAEIKAIDHILLNKKVAQNIKLYQAITREDVVEALKKNNIEIMPNYVFINNIIKTIGEHQVVINVYGNYETVLKVQVQASV